jgi:hypothetical protein
MHVLRMSKAQMAENELKGLTSCSKLGCEFVIHTSSKIFNGAFNHSAQKRLEAWRTLYRRKWSLKLYKSVQVNI